MGGGRIPGPPGCGLRPESCTGRKRGSRQRCVRMERAPEASATHATAWAASSRLHARKVRWAAALKLRIRLGRVLLFTKFVGLNFLKWRFLKKGGVVAHHCSRPIFPPLLKVLECVYGMGPKRPISLAVRAIEQIRLRVDLGNAAHVCAQIQNLVKGFSIEATPATAAKVVPSTAETPLDRVGRRVFPHGERRFGRAVGYSGNFLRQAQRQVL